MNKINKPNKTNKASKINKLQIRKELEQLGIKVIMGNYVKKSQVKKLLSSKKVKAHIPAKGKPIKLPCKYNEIANKFSHQTHAPDCYYIDFGKLPECIQTQFEKTKPVVDVSRYTVYEPIAFLRFVVETTDDAEINMEVHLGKIEREEREEEGDEESAEDLLEAEEDEEESQKYTADEMKATFDWRVQDVYFEVVRGPEELNLDAMSTEDLEEVVKDSNYPELRDYAKLKIKAMRLREAGKVNEALIIERKLDRMYENLPSNLKTW